MILGIDEVGRGCWAGPLVVGAVVLEEAIEGLADSKALSASRREDIHSQILASGAGIGLGWVSAEEIDEIGLSVALKLATRRAVRQVTKPFHQIIIDGTSNFLNGTPLESHVTVLKKADALMPSVSAASIVAKVERDRYMARQDELFQGYGFARNVGYGTKIHREAIESLGVSPLHRLSIAPLAKYRTEQLSVTPLAEIDKTITTRGTGDDSEDTVEQMLNARGYQILHRNWRTRLCEIDIVAEKNNCLFFVEAKHRTTDMAGDGLAAITSSKLKRMKLAAELYIHRYQLHDKDQRLAVASTSGNPPTVIDYLELG